MCKNGEENLKRNRVDFVLPGTKTYYKAMVIKTR